MENWKSFLRANPLDWLLEEDNPSVRFFTLTELEGYPADDPRVLEAQRQIMTSGLAQLLLARQVEDGYWGRLEDFYIRSKYKGTVWTFLILVQLGADQNDPRIHKTCEFILDHAQDPESGGFAYKEAQKKIGDPNGIIPCLTGNMLWATIRCGYLNDSRVHKGIDWITKNQRTDDGESWPLDNPLYQRFEKCWGRHTCMMGVVKGLKALTEIPEENRSPVVQSTIHRCAEFILQHHIYRRSHNLVQTANPAWELFGFPLMWNTDVLEMLDLLTRLGYRDPRMKEAIELVLAKQDEQGRWKLEQTFNGRMLARIEKEGQPSKWVTLRALIVLKRVLSSRST